MYKGIVVFIGLLVQFGFAQPNIDSLRKVDFLRFTYKNLSKDFKISMDSRSFDSAVKQYNFKPMRNYTDSLAVALQSEFNDWSATRIAASQINYKWERVGHYFLLDESQARALGDRFKMRYPYDVMRFLRNPNKTNLAKENFIKSYKKAAFELLGTEKVFQMPVKELSKKVFHKNPEIIRIKKEFFENLPKGEKHDHK